MCTLNPASTEQMESEEEEEEVLLFVELNGLPIQDTIQSCKGTCAILGIESEEPVLQVDNYVFKGRYEDILGTAMIFQQDKGRRLKYMCKTGKRLTMQRLFLKKKEESKEKCPPSSSVASHHGTATGHEGISGSSDSATIASRTDGSEQDTSVVSVSGSGTGEHQDSIPIPEPLDLTQ